MNDNRSQILYEKQRWAQRRAGIFNEAGGQEHELDPEITARHGQVAGGAYEFGKVHAGTAAGGSVRRTM